MFFHDLTTHFTISFQAAALSALGLPFLKELGDANGSDARGFGNGADEIVSIFCFLFLSEPLFFTITFTFFV